MKQIDTDGCGCILAGLGVLIFLVYAGLALLAWAQLRGFPLAVVRTLPYTLSP